MKIQIYIVIPFLCAISLYSQKDSVDLENAHRVLLFEHLPKGKYGYLVYFQDSLTGPMFNMEIWTRSIAMDSGAYHFSWERSFSNGSYATYTIKSQRHSFAPMEEKIRMARIHDGKTSQLNRHFIYDGNSMYTDEDPTEHNGEPFRVDNLSQSFNWEMDMETFSMLPLAEGRAYAINFYHPGSSTAPDYYEYKVTGSMDIQFDGVPHECWVLVIEYPDNHGTSSFWVDKKSHRVLKMKELYDGVYRFKLLLPN